MSGFTFSGLGILAQPSIRGVTTFLTGPGTENPNALYVDGIYQSTQVALNNELPDLEQIEVLKGPQGTLFGRNAVGGAIQIFTRQPSFTPTADVTVESGYYPKEGTSHSSAREDVRAFLSAPIVADLLAASVSGGYSYTQGYEYNDANGDRAGKIAKFNAPQAAIYTGEQRRPDSQRVLRFHSGTHYTSRTGSPDLESSDPWRGTLGRQSQIISQMCSFGDWLENLHGRCLIRMRLSIRFLAGREQSRMRTKWPERWTRTRESSF